MMNESQRRGIARKFLEERFGKRGKVYLRELNITVPTYNDFELWRDFRTIDRTTNEALAFEILFAPYVSDTEKKYIVVSDTKEELNKLVPQVFNGEHLTYGKYGEYYVVYC